jgi:hypothetical protein
VVGGLRGTPSLAMLLERIRFPFSALDASCSVGSCWTNDPSVTGTKANVPNGLASETFALAFWTTCVSAWRRHWSFSVELAHPAAETKSL